MNLEDLAKKTINEVNTQIEEQKRQKDLLEEQKKRSKDEEFEVLQILDEEELQEEDENLNSKEEKDLKPKEESNEKLQEEVQEEIALAKLHEEQNEKILVEEIKDNLAIEDIFLKNIKERILVLFEGLNSTKKEELQTRLDLTINFLEFLLANIEDKLKK